MYLLEDDLETELGLPQGEYDVPLVIADHAFNQDGSFRYEENVDLGFRGDTILVNGAISPRMAVQRRSTGCGSSTRSNARSYSLRLGNGRPMLQIAGDGGLLSRPVTRTSFPLHPAERVDLVLDFSRLRAGRGARALQRGRRGRHAPGHALRRRGRRRQRGLPGPDAACATPEPLPAANARRRWELALGSAAVADQRPAALTRTASTPARGGQHRDLDLRQQLQPRAPDAPARLPVPRAGALERHRSTLADKLGWKDTVGVLPNETVTVLRVVRALRRQVRLPLPLARARRQGDDAADGDRVMRAPRPPPRPPPSSLPPAAAAADVTIQAVDGTPPTSATPGRRPRRRSRSARPVTWSFAGTALAHNVKSNVRPNWDVLDAACWSAARPSRRRSPTPGTYAFLCELHDVAR